MNEKEKSEILKIFESIPDEFRVVESQINSDTITEYYELLEKLEKEGQSNNLKEFSGWKDLKSKEAIKELLVILSEVGDVKSYREIEKISESKYPEIIEFAHVALKFARLNLENQLSDEPIGFVSSELGGKENKLRYYFVIKSKKEIEKKKETMIVDELQKICGRSDSEFEEIENHSNYVLIKILVSIDFAIGNVIEQLINKCPFVDEEYLCTNVEKPTDEFINEWIKDDIE
jgi:hypothetical protein